MSIEWSEASSSVLHTAQEIIEKYHPHLAEASIAFVFRSEAGSSMGKFVIAKASKFPEKLKPLVDTDYDFLIWVSEEDWNKFDYEKRCALIDHELCHCGGNIDDGWTMVAHDVEEFSEIIERHGLWRKELNDMVDAAEKYTQLKLKVEDIDKPRGQVSSIKINNFSNVNVLE